MRSLAFGIVAFATATVSARSSAPFLIEAELVAGTSPSPPEVLCVETAPNSGIWDITVSLTGAVPPPSGGKATLKIEVSNIAPGISTGDAIGRIVIDSTDRFPFDGSAELEVWLQVGGIENEPLVADVGSIGLAEHVFDTDLIVADGSFVKGFLQDVAINSVQNLRIQGDIDNLFVHWNQGGAFAGDANGINALTVEDGDLTGTLYVEHGTAASIDVEGDIGSPSTSAVVLVRSNIKGGSAAIGEFLCNNLYANVQVGSSFLSLPPEVSRLFVRGDQYGFLYIPLAIYRVLPALEIAGDIAGEVIIGSAFTFISDDRAVRVSGDIRASGALKVNRWGDTTPAAHPKTVVGIGGSVLAGR